MGVLYDAIYAQYVYTILKKDCRGVDTVDEDYICHVVGVTGLLALKEYKLIEYCGIKNGRQRYTLVSRNSHVVL